MKAGLLAAGHYGNGRFDSLFHAVTNPGESIQWGSSDPDPPHGALLGECAGEGVSTTHIRSPTVGPAAPGSPDPMDFADTVVQLSLNEYFNGNKDVAIENIRQAVIDSRAEGPDTVFWDATRGLLVDNLTRLFYEDTNGSCLALANFCGVTACFHYMFPLKLGFLLYAIQVMGLTTDPVIAPVLPKMEARLWESQGAAGRAFPGVSESGGACSSTAACGIAFVVAYDHDGVACERSPPTGESTALAVMSKTAQAVP
jgi:hypothetical protein